MLVRGHRMRRFLPLAALALLTALLTALLIVWLSHEARPAPPSLIGKAAPAFTLPRLHDAASTLGPDELRGKVWVLNVWASWCAPCREEHPLLVALARDERVLLVGLNHRDDPRDAQEWLLRLGDPYAATPLDRDGSAGMAWGVAGVPQTFVIDREGVVRFRHVGPLTRELWRSDVQPLLARLQG